MPDSRSLSDHWEPRPGEMHPVDEAFYKLAIKDRDYERTRVNSLMAENKRWLGLVRDLRAENTWLRNQMGDVRGMQSDGATPEEMDEALGRALSIDDVRVAAIKPRPREFELDDMMSALLKKPWILEALASGLVLRRRLALAELLDAALSSPRQGLTKETE